MDSILFAHFFYPSAISLLLSLLCFTVCMLHKFVFWVMPASLFLLVLTAYIILFWVWLKSVCIPYVGNKTKKCYWYKILKNTFCLNLTSSCEQKLRGFNSIFPTKYVVGSKRFWPDQLFKVTEIKQLCYFST